jgi:hypothetical protein
VLLVLVGLAFPGGSVLAEAVPGDGSPRPESALLILNESAELETVTAALEAAGGRVIHIFPPSALIAQLPVGAGPLAGVEATFRQAVPTAAASKLNVEHRRAAELWNHLQAGESSSAEERVTASDLSAELVNDAFVAPVPNRVQSDAAASDLSPDATQTSEFMIGRVAVGIVLPESDGSVDESTETWTAGERSQVLGEITAALDWWAALEPRANLSFVYDDGTAAPIETSYEPIQRPYSDQGLWITEVMAEKGFNGSTYFDQVRGYNQTLRETYDADWAFTIFVVDSSNDGDNRFSDRHFAYAYLGGPFAVLTSGCNGYGIDNLDAVVAHEIGHIFLALDQYRSARQPCTRRSGYLGAENQNSQYGDCALDESSVMRGQVSPFQNDHLDTYARAQIGWQDSDGDGIFDPVDTNLQINGVDYETDPVRTNVFTFTGEILDEPYPSPLRRSVTINTVERVEWRVGDSDWVAADPVDGGFDSYREGFSFTTPPLPTGEAEVEIRAVDSAGNTAQELVATVSAVDPMEGILETTLTRMGPQAMDERSSEVTYRGSGSSAEETFVADVYYRIDEGPWESVAADDGAFDETEESFTLSIALEELSPGEHEIEVYAVDGQGYVDTSPARDTLEVTLDTKQIFLPLVVSLN